MLRELKNAIVLLALLTIVTGVAYPLAITGLAQVAFPHQANGSLLPQGRGSSLIAQPVDDAMYFWPRPSSAAYNGAASSGTNYAQTNPALVEAATARVAALRAADPGNDRPIPVDLVTASASGLDPHVSVAAADYQLERVAQARGLDVTAVRRLVAACTERTFGDVLGPPCVNVVRLNLMLDGKLTPE